jgi:hypothetical protein
MNQMGHARPDQIDSPRRPHENNVAGVCRIRTRAREARRSGSIPGGDTLVSVPRWNGGVPWQDATIATRAFFETMSKRRRGFPSETRVKRGVRIVNGGKLLEEKLGRNDLCPCGSGRLFKKCCLMSGRF